jgi:uncharacterized protein (DUF924 family)
MTQMTMPLSPDDVLSFWLGDASRPRDEWFRRSDALDDEIRSRFAGAIEQAERGELDAWEGTARGRLAIVILLDQFSRNAFRGTARSFAHDPRALAIAERGVELGEDRTLLPLERSFLYMPFSHAEDPAVQARSCTLFEWLAAEAPAELAGYLDSALKFARAHRAIVDRFGRFPHRNAILGRTTTHEEAEFLKQPGSSF